MKAAFLSVLSVALATASAEEVSVARWQRQYEAWNKLAPHARPEEIRWSPDGSYLAYAWNDPTTGVSWRLVDCRDGSVRAAFDADALAGKLTRLTGKAVSPSRWPFSRVQPTDQGALRLESDREAWLLSPDGELSAVPSTKPTIAAILPGPAKNAGRASFASSTNVGELSPDGGRKVSIKDGNVYLTDGGKAALTRALTTDGRADDGWVGPAHWAPDGRHFALWRERRSDVRRYAVVNSVKQTRKQIPYEKPGDERTTRTPWVFSVEGQPPSAPGREVLPLAYETTRLDWTADSKRLRSAYVRRGFTGHGVIEYDVGRAAWRVLLAEEDPKFVFSFGQFFRHDLSEHQTLWASERSGWLHLYQVDLDTGETIRPVTAGAWVMKQVAHVDAKAGAVTFVALGRNEGENPYHQHVCRVGFDGAGLVDLTPGDATHAAIFSPDRTTLIDVASRHDVPPSYTLRRGSDGRALALLGSAGGLEPLKQAGWSPSVAFTAKDRDGKFDIWGQFVRPFPFDPSKKYPVLESIYAGPHDSHVSWGFGFWNRNFREGSLQGFYVVRIDGRGTWNRGKEFHQQAWRDLKDGGFPDRIAWLKALARQEPSMDLSKVGIFGGSAGGQNAAHALLLHGDFYQAGAADCGCHDNRVDKLWWNEQWLGYPVGGWYAQNACSAYADRLRGRLFLSVGESDTNVDVRCSYDFRDALWAAGKKDQVEFHVVPGADHGAGERDDMREKRLRFFQKALGSPH